MQPRRGELRRLIEALGLGPVGGLLLGSFLMVGFIALITIPVTPPELRGQELRFYGVLLGLLLAGTIVSMVVGGRARAMDAPEERMPSLTGTRGGVSLRLAIDSRVAPALAESLATHGGRPAAELLRADLAILVREQDAWRAASIDPLPRAPEDRTEALARRMSADATSRLDAREGARPAGGEGALVVSIVVTTALTVEAPATRDRRGVSSLLRNLSALASDAASIDVRVSPPAPLATILERDRGLAPL